jgi:hypothetical protein
MADPKPTKKTTTETFKVYGQDIDVTYDYSEDPEKGKVLELNKIGDKIDLNPSQEILSSQLFLPEYIQAKYKTDPKGGNDWLKGILHEIIIDKCRTDRDVIGTKPCINFQAYLMQLASQIQRDPTKIPYIPQSRIGSTIEIQKRIKAKANAAGIGVSGEMLYGDLKITFTVDLKDILTPDPGPGPGPSSSSESEPTTDTSTDTSDESHTSDDSEETRRKRNRKVIKKKIKKTFKPSDCSKEANYAAITEDDIRRQITGGNPMEALYLLFKQYRGKTCSAGNALAESLPFDEYVKMMLNQGNHQFNQYRRIYRKLYQPINGEPS